MEGTVTTKIRYTPAGQSGSVESPPTSAKVNDGSTGTATAEAGAHESFASAENPNDEGGTDTVEQRWKMPDGATFEQASVRLTLECSRERILTLECAGNVSVAGSISSGCISCVEVNREPGTNGVVCTTTRRKKKCCES